MHAKLVRMIKITLINFGKHFIYPNLHKQSQMISFGEIQSNENPSWQLTHNEVLERMTSADYCSIR